MSPALVCLFDPVDGPAAIVTDEIAGVFGLGLAAAAAQGRGSENV